MDVTATFIALCDVHTSCMPTGKFSQAHTTIDPSLRLYNARAYKFTHAIYGILEHFVARGTKPILLSIGLDGFACKPDLILPWFQRSPPFTLVIRENKLVYDMQVTYFPQHESRFYYGLLESHDLRQALSAEKAAEDAVKNLLAARKACQD
ncbi:hypothetical protein BKA58DRAFT_443075 [Alternaria rosae]|uniref:uncharacterized protein n=1 Tax=Alternaria rosae TaxID=1187941 RepID=UPI001E8ECB6E|nr:uncharacterized protein BKA58DRAFT_443075 [Alternaria rosae]KAH6865015.1 hypothetical protein BKA58DRAFT_443075 [Alternaria rosae]